MSVIQSSLLRAVTHASYLYTGSGVRKKGGRHIVDEDLEIIPDGAMVYSVKKIGSGAHQREVPNQIHWIGPTAKLPKQWKFKKSQVQNLKQSQAVMPGMVDCHNHLIFSGDRSAEFAERCTGVTYEEIAQKGGGIASTVRATRAATVQVLESLACERLATLERYGIRTVEIKSGYGLTWEAEMRILKLIPRLRKKFPQMTLTATFLGAHAFPPEVSSETGRQAYFKNLLEEQLPRVAQGRLADACDIFIDRGYFTVAQGRILLQRAKELGLRVKVHADELGNTESAELAVELGALSADHLLQISARGIQKLAESETVAVLLPGTAFYLKAAHAPARQLLHAGAVVALSTDFNPGTSMCLSLPTVMTIAALYLGMSRSEIFAAVTYNAAKALGLQKSKGTLEVGQDADFFILPFLKFEDLYYRFAWVP